jgi:dTDP-6-deoxy-L-talose 4-dehydrogenase (NAD+)
MKVLVTGATGFIGNYVIEELLNRNIEVIATSTSINNAKLKSWYNEVKFVEHDIKNYSENLVEKFYNPDILIHLAWRGLPNYKSLFHIEEELLTQYFFLKKIIQQGIDNINITGTCFEYGNQEGCLNEDNNPALPSNSYSIAKDCLRQFILLLKNDNSFSLKWMRLFYMYGKGQNEKSILKQLQEALDRNEKSFNMSGGEQIRDYQPVEKIAESIVTCSLQTQIDGLINISSNIPIKIIDLVKTYLIEQNKSIYLNLGFYQYPDYEPFAFWGDNTKLKQIYKLNNYEPNRKI